MQETNGHPSGAIIYVIIGTHLLIAVYFIWLTLSATKLVSAMEDYRQTDKSDVDRLKAVKKKIIFHSVVVIILLAIPFCLIILRRL